MVILFLDAVREISKYTQETDLKVTACANEVSHMRQFRAQRNYYITMFSLFLCFIIWRLVSRTSPDAPATPDEPSAHDNTGGNQEERDNNLNKEHDE
ncbi:hypothetical protein ScPMuIL_006050 [Solemya velum]